MKFLLSILISSFVLTATVHAAAPDAVDGATTVTTAEAKKLFDEGGAIFVDVRGAESFALGHIQGSINVPLTEEFAKSDLERAVKPSQPVLFYCSGVQCGISAHTSKKALEWGYTKVYYYRGGYPEWVNEGYPISVGN